MNYYKKSRLILCVLAVIISLIMMHNEDISLISAATIAITIAVLVFSIITTPISKKILGVGDNFKKKVHSRLFFFVVIPVGILVAALGTIAIMMFYDKCIDLDVNLGGALIVVFIFTAIFIALVVPYIQVLIILALRAWEHKNSRKK